MSTRVQTSQRVPLVRVNLQLIRLTRLDQGIYELGCVVEMYVLVDQSVND